MRPCSRLSVRIVQSGIHELSVRASPLRGQKSSPVLVLAHGAGQGIDSLFMVHFGESIAQRGVSVVQFEFEYMRTARATGKRKPPDREPKLRARWHDVVA